MKSKIFKKIFGKRNMMTTCQRLLTQIVLLLPSLARNRHTHVVHLTSRTQTEASEQTSKLLSQERLNKDLVHEDKQTMKFLDINKRCTTKMEDKINYKP